MRFYSVQTIGPFTTRHSHNVKGSWRFQMALQTFIRQFRSGGIWLCGGQRSAKYKSIWIWTSAIIQIERYERRRMYDFERLFTGLIGCLNRIRDRLLQTCSLWQNQYSTKNGGCGTSHCVCVLVYAGHCVWPPMEGKGHLHDDESGVGVAVAVMAGWGGVGPLPALSPQGRPPRTQWCDWPPLGQEIEEEQQRRKGVISRAKLPTGQIKEANKRASKPSGQNDKNFWGTKTGAFILCPRQGVGERSDVSIQRGPTVQF